jgi:GNAT superfamily N-acetyltransferase
MSELNCSIRLATDDDAQAISRVVIAALRASNAQDYPPQVIAQVETSFTPSAVKALLSRRMTFVGLDDNRVLATASLDGDVVRSVFVDPLHQGRGIGKTLMATIHGAALAAGIGSVRVPSSITAQGFYEALGYQKVRDEYHGAERTVIMEKTLAREFET